MDEARANDFPVTVVDASLGQAEVAIICDDPIVLKIFEQQEDTIHSILKKFPSPTIIEEVSTKDYRQVINPNLTPSGNCPSNHENSDMNGCKNEGNETQREDYSPENMSNEINKEILTTSKDLARTKEHKVEEGANEGMGS